MNMYKIYLKQAWALLKENKLLSGVSIFGTALAICMIMVIVILYRDRMADAYRQLRSGRLSGPDDVRQ